MIGTAGTLQPAYQQVDQITMLHIVLETGECTTMYPPEQQAPQ